MFLMGFLQGYCAVRERAAIRFVTTRIGPAKDGVWNLRSTTLFGTPLCRTSLFCNQNVVRVFSVLVRSLEELIEHEN